VGTLSVSQKRNVLDKCTASFDERKVQLADEQVREEEKVKHEKGSPFRSFIQMNKTTYELEDKLMKDNPLAYRIWRFLANNMDNYNAVIVSYATMMGIFDVSRMTLYRAIKTLADGNYLRIYKTGTANVYALNDTMVWNSWGSNKQYSKFSASVIISEDEQSENIKKTIKDIKIEKHKEVKLK